MRKFNWQQKTKFKYLFKIVYEIFIICLALIYSVHFYNFNILNLDIYVQRTIDVVFVFDLIFNIISAPKKWNFIRKNYWMLIVILPIPILKPLQMIRLFYVFRMTKILLILEKVNLNWISKFEVLKNIIYSKYYQKWLKFLLYNLISVPILMNVVEPQTFSDFGNGLWWFIVTLTTVGYGDIHPVTTIGKIFATYSLIIGVFSYASFIAIITDFIHIFSNKERWVLKYKREIELEKRILSLEIQNKRIIELLEKSRKK